MLDLKTLKVAIDQIEEERGIPRAHLIDAIERALESAYKKEYGKPDQIIEATFNTDTGDISFEQKKIVIDESGILPEGEKVESEEDTRVHFNPERHIMLEDAKKIKGSIEVGEALSFPIKKNSSFGRIATQNAKQIITQKLREAEKETVISEFSEKEGTIVSGSVRRFERRNILIDLGRTMAILPYNEQIPNERFKQGEIIKAYVLNVNTEASRGNFVTLSRSAPEFVVKLFELESPEVANGNVTIKSIAREAGSRTKISVTSDNDRIDPVGALIGQHGVRVSMVTGELHGERIDVIEWSANPATFIEEALSPARITSIDLDEENNSAKVFVPEDQISLSIGHGGQNVRLAAKLTGWSIDIESVKVEGATDDAETGGEGEGVGEGVGASADAEEKEADNDEVSEAKDSEVTKENEVSENEVGETESKEESEGESSSAKKSD
ncbi:MAG: transcription termination factor NusA [Candidatus Campbellbacteria bacterium]|nr:transcription termination factor NusA [Candidatus Campbellbacteria bacterium]